MAKRNAWWAIAAACCILAPVAARAGEQGGMQHAAHMTDAQMIESAMKAAPAAVAKDATVIAMNDDGSVREVRKGSNGFTCMADNPETPGPDPMCADANAMGWIQAWLGKQTPASDKVGLMYMLAGGTDASNTDPHATKPTAENHWVSTGPHLMVVGAPSLLTAYPQSADPDTSSPYVMWAGTPYAHLMIPVQ